VFVHALSGAASFAACLRLFRSFPLAVTTARPEDISLAAGQRHPGDPRRPGAAYRSIVLRHCGFDGSGYYVLTQDPAEQFTLRPWHPDEGERHEILPGLPVPVTCHRVITEGMPVPRDGALFGWVSDRQVTVLMSVYHGSPNHWSPNHGQPSGRYGVPQVRVLAAVGSEPMRWPPFTASPLDDGRLWEYVERGEIVDLAPVVSRGEASWVPSQNSSRAIQGHGCVVVAHSLVAEDYWVPSGIYMDHWMLREGVPTPPASHLLTLPGATDLARHLAAAC
jgi:hypothetical protein